MIRRLGWVVVLGCLTLFAARPAKATSHGYILDLCEVVDVAVVGRAIEKRSFWQEQATALQPLPPRIVTEFQFETEMLYIGQLPTAFSHIVLGGEVPGQRSWVSGEPRIDVGDRYFFAFQVLPTTGERRLILYYYVPPEYQLPAPRLARRAWTDLCAQHPEGIFKGDRIKMQGNRLVVEHARDPETM